MKPSKKHYVKSIYLTILVYALLIFILFISIRSAHLLTSNTNPHAKIVQAVTVNQTQVNAEIQKIKTQEAEKKTLELTRQKQLAREAQQAKAQREQEEKRLTALKMQQKQLEIAKQQAEEKAKATLAEMQKKQEMMKQQLAAIQQQKIMANQHKPSTPPVTAKTILSSPAASVEKKTAQPEDTNLSSLEKNLQNQINAEQQQMNAAHHSALLSEMDKYKALILNAIGQQWIMPANVDKKLSMELLIRLAPGGTVLDVNVLKSSSDTVLDRSVLTAVWKASPLPVPTDLQLFDSFRELHLTVRPEGLLTN